MSTQPPKPPSYLRHKAKNKAFVYVRVADGKRRTIYLPGAYNSPESHRRYREIVAAIMTGQPIDSPRASESLGGIGLAELTARFLAWAEGYYRKPDGSSTREFPNFVLAARPLLKLFRDEFANDFGPLKLKGVREEMLDQGWSRPVINKQIRRVKMMLRWGVENELVDPSVHQALQAVTGLKKGRCDAPEPKPIQAVEWPDVEVVLPHVSPQIRAMILVQWHTGMRPGEVVIMRTGNIDREGEVWTYFPESHKTEHHGKQRLIQLGPKAQTIIKPFLRLDPDLPLFQPKEAEDVRRKKQRMERKTRVQPSQRVRQQRCQDRPRATFRDHYSADTFAKAIRRACAAAGIEPWGPNQLRHARATEIRKRFGLEAAQVSLGHASADVTQVYAERDLELARKVALETG